MKSCLAVVGTQGPVALTIYLKEFFYFKIYNIFVNTVCAYKNAKNYLAFRAISLQVLGLVFINIQINIHNLYFIKTKDDQK